MVTCLLVIWTFSPGAFRFWSNVIGSFSRVLGFRFRRIMNFHEMIKNRRQSIWLTVVKYMGCIKKCFGNVLGACEVFEVYWKEKEPSIVTSLVFNIEAEDIRYYRYAFLSEICSLWNVVNCENLFSALPLFSWPSEFIQWMHWYNWLFFYHCDSGDSTWFLHALIMIFSTW